MSIEISDLKKIAEYLRDLFDGSPNINRYYSPDESRYVDIIHTNHSDDLTDIGTIGGCLRKNHTEPEIPVEILGVIDRDYLEVFAETLSFIVLCMDTYNYCYMPGTVIIDAIPNNQNYSMKHIWLWHPFCWDNIDTLELGEHNVAFLQAIPISEEERIYILENGSDAFEDLMEINNAQYFDLNRNPVL